MAWPKGLLRADAERMKQDGTWDAWIKNYRAQNPDASKTKSTAVPKAAKAARAIDSLTTLHDYGRGFIEAINCAPIHGQFELAKLEALQTLMATLQTVGDKVDSAINALLGPIERLQHEAQLVERAEELTRQNEALEAKLAEMEEIIRVAGHGDKIGGGHAALDAPTRPARGPGRPKAMQGDNRPAA